MTRREGRTCKQLLATTQRLSHSIGRICEPRDAISVAPRCTHRRFSSRIYRATGGASGGSTPRSESCATPSLTCAISHKAAPRTSHWGSLLDEPASAPTRAGSSLPSTSDRPLGYNLRTHSISAGSFARPPNQSAFCIRPCSHRARATQKKRLRSTPVSPRPVHELSPVSPSRQD